MQIKLEMNTVLSQDLAKAKETFSIFMKGQTTHYGLIRVKNLPAAVFASVRKKRPAAEENYVIIAKEFIDKYKLEDHIDCWSQDLSLKTQSII